MKSIMTSIRPQWVAKILNGEKTLEMRKTNAKLETQFKCYAACGGEIATKAYARE